VVGARRDDAVQSLIFDPRGKPLEPRHAEPPRT
jgi:hypothetical protein